MARAPVATDDFNRAALGSDWRNLVPGFSGNVAIFTNTEFGGATSGVLSVACWVGSGGFSDDQYSSAVFAKSTFGSASYGIAVLCRSSDHADANLYLYYHYATSNDISVLARVVNGVETILHNAAVTWSDGDRVELEVEGTTIRAMKNGVALGGLFTQTDGTVTTGKPGIGAAGDAGVATGDNWEGGNLAGGPELGHGERAAVRLLRPN